MILSECPCCQRRCKIEIRRRNTNHKKDSLNYITSCKDCYKADCDMLADLWKDYENSV